MENKQNIYFLKNPIQYYDWGSRSFIPKLLGLSSPSSRPHAELWMGAHPKAPSHIKTSEGWISLWDLCRKEPDHILGSKGEFPFLMKVIAVEKPLSIQAHPDEKQAREGYHRENSLKIPIDSPTRNYRDPNPKPEMLCALTEFQALKGLRPPQDIIELLDGISSESFKQEIEALKSHEQPMKGFFKEIISKRINPKQRESIIQQVIRSIQKTDVPAEIAEIILKLHAFYPNDIGILSPLFLNLIKLMPHEAICIAPGELHAYLLGAGIELMTNSDNVLRGGLTSKHVDTEELLRILRYEPGSGDKIKPLNLNEGQMVYQCPGQPFLLSIISIKGEISCKRKQNHGPEIMICTSGMADIVIPKDGVRYSLKKGHSLLVASAVTEYTLKGDATIFCARIP